MTTTCGDAFFDRTKTGSGRVVQASSNASHHRHSPFPVDQWIQILIDDVFVIVLLLRPYTRTSFIFLQPAIAVSEERTAEAMLTEKVNSWANRNVFLYKL
jgi:hypothetical protein